MISQIAITLKKLHSFGYSHGDIKPENICCQSMIQDSYTFTLIDFGVSSKLPLSGVSKKSKEFRGNLKFATTEQITNKRATRIDDLFSLMYVAYDFAIDILPWEK